MTIQEEGFLASETDIFIGRHRAAHAPAFALARDLNRLGQKALRRENVAGKAFGDVEPLIFLLLVRTLSNFQGAILMAERGALVESRTLSRSCLETVFCLAALARGGDEFIHRLSSALLADRTSTANWILQKPAVREAMGQANIDTLRQFVDGTSARLDTLQKLGIEEMARQGELDPLYTWYRQLSGDAAHPTLDALERYLVTGDGGEQEIRWGPDCDGEELEWTVLLSCNWLFAGLHAAEDRSGIGIDRADLAALWERFQLLSRQAGGG
ncbi:MAG TPA: DUF5677 domain-containing protein [Acetobacteraceae bacterium]